MSKKYKHLGLDRKFFLWESAYVWPARRLIEDKPEIDYTQQKPRIVAGVNRIKESTLTKSENYLLPEDKGYGELQVKFYGQPQKQMLEKYGINVYEYNRKENSVIWGINNKKLPWQDKSDLDRLVSDSEIYAKTNNLKSYFEKIEIIEPLSIAEILEKSVVEIFSNKPDKRIMVDVSFSGFNKEKNKSKIETLKQLYSNNFISQVNTTLVHFCRMDLSYEEIQDICTKFSGIRNISISPVYDFETSSINQIEESINIIPPNSEHNPVIVIDGRCNPNHKTISNAIIECNNITSEWDTFHSTAVCSLVVCWWDLSPNGDIVQKNNVISVEVDPFKVEEKIIEIVEKYSIIYPLLLINCSLNHYSDPAYDWTKVNNLTVLLDELASKYNCLFFISAWNNFSHWWTEPMKNISMAMQYPNYYSLPFTNILPPSDSINNIAVGSITYQASPRSVAPPLHPSPITKINFDQNVFVKPDLVHYDWNFIINSSGRLESEWNGVYMAGGSDNQLTHGCGTSFATPLVSHEAWIIHNSYPEYSSNTVKALLIHFAEYPSCTGITNANYRSRLIWFGKANIDKALFSLSHSSTIIIEDSISINHTKKIRIPIPESIQWSHRKRLKLKKTLVFNPKPYPQDRDNYNPLKISAWIIRCDDQEIESFTTRDRLSGAHIKSNVKRYDSIELSTNNDFCWKFWEIEVRSECKISDYLTPPNFKQPYSIILTIEDLNQDPSIDLHQEISQMIEVELPIEISS